VNSWDDVFQYADETVDYLKSALANAEKILAAAREQQKTQLPVLTAVQLRELHNAGWHLRDEVADAATAAENLWDEVKEL